MIKVICFPITSIDAYNNDKNERKKIQETILTMVSWSGVDINIAKLKQRKELTKEELLLIPDGLTQDYLFAVIEDEG